MPIDCRLYFVLLDGLREDGARQVGIATFYFDRGRSWSEWWRRSINGARIFVDRYRSIDRFVQVSSSFLPFFFPHPPGWGRNQINDATSYCTNRTPIGVGMFRMMKTK
mmetsp:Transcript_2866/g.7794  ORF Transcript_2866/g.7794 Transcript_2866/m.7794 type:complete len:108 (+) Transcript_2866:1077-1400(+)